MAAAWQQTVTGARQSAMRPAFPEISPALVAEMVSRRELWLRRATLSRIHKPGFGANAN